MQFRHNFKAIKEKNKTDVIKIFFWQNLKEIYLDKL